MWDVDLDDDVDSEDDDTWVGVQWELQHSRMPPRCRGGTLFERGPLADAPMLVQVAVLVLFIVGFVLLFFMCFALRLI